jgi:hypothetical protein
VLTQLERAVKRAHDDYDRALVASRSSESADVDGE